MNLWVADRQKLSRQGGALLPIIAISLLVILGAAGLAIDSSHAFLNSSRLQNALDAAALSAAKTLNETAGNTALATAHGNEAFTRHLEGELASSVPTLSFSFSATLSPFQSATQDTRFVRVATDDYSIPVWFARVMPGVSNELNLGTTAVAGPIPLGGGQVCDIAPMLVCGDPTDSTADDGTLFGLNYGNEADQQCLKASKSPGGNGNGNGNNGNNGNGNNGKGKGNNGNNGNGNNGNGNNGSFPPDCQPPIDTIGPGNFQLIQLDCGPGANCVRLSLAGEFQSCLFDSDSVPTKPGNSVGPTAQGLNTRFGQYQGPVNSTDHPPDLVTGYPITYSQYQSAYYNQQFDSPSGSARRRVLAVPIGDCSGIGGGQTVVPVLGFGCYFLTEPTIGTGQSNWVKGHLIEDCEVSGAPGENPDTSGVGYSTYKIILYNDPDNLAS